MESNTKKALALLAVLAMSAVPVCASMESDADGLVGYGEGKGITVVYEEAVLGGKQIGTLLITLSEVPESGILLVTVDMKSIQYQKELMMGGNEIRLGSERYLLREGTHSVSVSADKSYSVSCKLIVSEPTPSVVPVTGVSLDRISANIDEGSSIRLHAVVSPGNATNKEVSWASGSEKVATVDGIGSVSALSAGTADITVTTVDGSFTATCRLTVNAAGTVIHVESVFLDRAEASMTVGSELTLTATVSPSDATDKSVAWSSDDDSVVSISQSGKATAVSAGIARITATTVDGSYTAFCDITVSSKAVTGVTVSSSTLSISVGGSSSLKASVSPSDAIDKDVTWNSSDPSTVKVDDKGKVTGVKEGTATVTVTTVDGGFSASCEVTVRMVKVTAVTLSDSSIELDVGGTYRLTATVSPSDATDKKVNWSSSDKSVATVDASGNVKATVAGTAVITASSVDGSKSAQCTVTVKNPAASGEIVEESEHSKTTAVKKGGTWSSVTVLRSNVSVRGDAIKVTVIGAEMSDAVRQITLVRERAGDMNSTITVSAGSSHLYSVEFTIDADALGMIGAVSGLSLSFESEAADVRMDESATRTLSSMEEGVMLSLSVTYIDDVAGGAKTIKGAKSVSIDIAGQGSQLHELKGTATVSVPYSAPLGIDIKGIAAWCIDSGTPEKVSFYSYDSYEGIMSFETGHMSGWVIGVESGSPVASADSNVLIIAAVIVIAAICIAVLVIVLRRKGSSV